MDARLDQFELRDALRIEDHDFAVENRLLRFDVMRSTCSSGYCRSQRLLLRV